MNIINQFLSESIDESVTKNGRRQAVKVFVINDKKILFLRIHSDDCGNGKWDIPGGGINEGEKIRDAVKREVFEETSLELDNIKKLTEKNGKLDVDKTGYHCDYTFYIADAKGTDVQLRKSECAKMDFAPEHNEYKWVDQIWQLEEMDMVPDFKRIAKKLLKRYQKDSK